MGFKVADAMAALRKQIAHLLDEMALVFGDVPLEFLARADHDFRGGGRRGRANVGDKIGDGEIGLVAHAGDNGNLRVGNRPRDDFFVEGPQIFERAAAARHDHHVGKFRAIEIAQRRGDFLRRAFALHFHGIELHVDIGEAALQHAQNVANGGARR